METFWGRLAMVKVTAASGRERLIHAELEVTPNQTLQAGSQRVARYTHWLALCGVAVSAREPTTEAARRDLSRLSEGKVPSENLEARSKPSAPCLVEDCQSIYLRFDYRTNITEMETDSTTMVHERNELGPHLMWKQLSATLSPALALPKTGLGQLPAL
jgi:hypothetical protein